MQQPDAFSLLKLPAAFAIDEAALEDAWKRAITLVHPDRFAGRPAAERRVAEQWAGRINEAREVLADPVRRAQLLLKAAGVDVGSETDTRMPADFLMQQLEWREALEEAAGNAEAIRVLAQTVESEQNAIEERLQKAIDETHDYEKARDDVRRLMFVVKFAAQIRRELSEKA